MSERDDAVPHLLTLDPPTGSAPVDADGVVSHRATGPQREMLRRQAGVLRLLAHHAVVRVVDLADAEGVTVLRTVRAGTTTAADPSLPIGRRRLALAAGARAIADLHRDGWAHGRPTADHLVVGPRGRVRWCSLARATPLPADPDAVIRDRAILLRTTTDAIGPAGDRQLRRRLRRLGDAPDPDELADALVGRRRLDPRIAVAAMTATGLAMTGMLLRADTVVADAATAADLRTGPSLTVVGIRHRVGRDGDVLAVADPGCTGDRTLWLLRPEDGRVFVFPVGTAAGTSTAGRLVAEVDGAVGWAPAPRCRTPLVQRGDGTVEAVAAP